MSAGFILLYKLNRYGFKSGNRISYELQYQFLKSKFLMHSLTFENEIVARRPSKIFPITITKIVIAIRQYYKVVLIFMLDKFKSWFHIKKIEFFSILVNSLTE